MKLSFFKKSALLIVSLIILIGILVTALVYYFGYQHSKNTRTENIGLITQQVARLLSHEMEDGVQLSKIIAADPSTVKILNGSPSKSELESLTMLFSHYGISTKPLAIYVMNSDGLTIASTDQTFVGKNYRFRKYFKEAMIGRDYIDFNIGSTSNQAGYYFSSPVKDDKQRVLGVLVVKRSDQFIRKLLSSFIDTEMTPLFENILLVDEYGVVTVSAEEGKEMHHLGGINQEEIQQLVKTERYGNNTIELLSYGEAYKNLYRDKEYLDLTFFDEADDKTEYIGLLQVPNTNFSILVEVLNSFIEAPATGFSFKLAYTVMIGVVIVILLVIFCLDRITSPLRTLNIIAERVSRGDFGYREWVRSGDEIEDIADSVYRMADICNQKNNSNNEIDTENKTNEVLVPQDRSTDG